MPGSNTTSPGSHVAARGAHVLAELRDLDRDEIAVDNRALDHHDCVGTVGHRRAGHDADRLAGSDRNRRRRARGQLADHAQASGRIGGADGVAVHAGVREGRHRLGCDDVGREHQAARVGAIDRARRERR